MPLLWLLQESREVHFFKLRPSIQLTPNGPFQLIKTKFLNHGHIDLQLVFHAEETIKPKHSSGPQNPVDIIQYELQQLCRDPIAQDMHGMNNVQGIIKEWQPLRNSDIHGDNPSGSNEVVEGPIEVHGSCDNGHIPLPHSHGKSSSSAPNVQPNSNSFMLQLQDLVYGVIDVRSMAV